VSFRFLVKLVGASYFGKGTVLEHKQAVYRDL